MDIKGHVVERLWIEHASDIDEEYYASFTLDRAAKQHLLMLSARGGVDIEEVASTDPDAIVKLHVNPVTGIDEATAAAGRGRRPASPSVPSTALPRCSSSCTAASPRATVTSPRSTR